MEAGGKAYHLGEYKQESSATAAVAAAREALARGKQIAEYLAEVRPKRKQAERQSATVGVNWAKSGRKWHATVRYGHCVFFIASGAISDILYPHPMHKFLRKS